MKEYILLAFIGAGLAFGAFKSGQTIERMWIAERTKTAIEKQMRVQTENELEVRQMGDVARCAALGGKLRKNGECR